MRYIVPKRPIPRRFKNRAFQSLRGLGDDIFPTTDWLTGAYDIPNYNLTDMTTSGGLGPSGPQPIAGSTNNPTQAAQGQTPDALAAQILGSVNAGGPAATIPTITAPPPAPNMWLVGAVVIGGAAILMYLGKANRKAA